MYLIENTYSKLRYSSAGLLSKKGWIDSHASYFLTGIMLTALALAFIHSAILQTVNSSNRVDAPWYLAQNLIKGKGLTACNNDYFPFCKNTSQLTGTENEAQMDSFYFANALHLIFQYPRNYLKLSIYRFLPLGFDTGVKAVYGQPPDPADFVVFCMQLVLLIAVVIGIIRMRSRASPYVLAAALFCGAHMAVNSQQSYLVGIMPMLIILASFSLFDLRSSSPSLL